MLDTAQKNKQLFDLYKNIKDGTEILSVEDLEIAIKTLELAKEQLKMREQKRLQKAALEALKNNPQNSNFQGKILYLPDNLKRLKSNAFKGNKEIVKVVINKGCTEIGEYAFEGCVNLREIVFPNNRIILRRGCFKDCSSLKEVFIPDISNICPLAFENCISLVKVYLPKTISNIYTGVFKNCRSLHTVEFEERTWNHTSICSKAFENCISLETIELPNTCIADAKTFLNCHNLKTIYIHYRWMYMKEFEKCEAKIIKI